MKIVLGVLIGALVGFVIGYFGKCASGVCPLTSNPIVSTIIGALIGLMIVLGK
jgi:phage shock protein E